MSLDKSLIGTLDKAQEVETEIFWDITHADSWTFRQSGLARLTDAATDSAAITRKVPDDFIRLLEVILVVNNSTVGAGNLYWRPRTAIQANGETWATHGGSGPYRTTALLSDIVTELPDISGEANCDLDDLEIGDYLGILIQRDATGADDTIVGNVDVLGVLFKYVAEVPIHD